MNAESFIKEKEITWDKPFSNWNRTAFKKALNEFADKYHNEQLLIHSVVVPKGTLCSEMGCQNDAERVVYTETWYRCKDH